MRTRIKLCGFQTEDTVRAATRAGADAVGFVFYPPSPRHIEVAQAGQLARCLGVWQTPVALFVNPQADFVNSVISEIPNVLLQFHGDESPQFCDSFRRPYIKAIRMKAGVDLRQESVRFHSAQALLVDSWSEAYGGTGHTFDWSLLPKAGELKQALVLSGGLDASNVEQAIHGLRPYGVDVSSGIESARGVKSVEKIEMFCKAVQKADAGLL
ncbi:MAG: phosphoribosylanthranilate isomerase [Limnobacter sp.]|jgi:phosphoribosylanthranilate isomerase|uniref:phosphoribosylanthranilate isomerase n=1 Tax=unclassified Limnobacter TaxID=2630203 RepID=UPI000CF484E1|nr:phosphoribosylanthranilate isomerase [Limnobacter sp. SAORIC-690]MBU0541577.1 phosphoribosylanthranilate isomerase [Gammaproteobacteria bacterium]PQJ25590.1 N-(5'-phosphoribosyl)anthranilate isomerase [Limnobacter sp. SAORIC-690]